jgi:hypothetical protein
MENMTALSAILGSLPVLMLVQSLLQDSTHQMWLAVRS